MGYEARAREILRAARRGGARAKYSAYNRVAALAAADEEAQGQLPGWWIEWGHGEADLLRAQACDQLAGALRGRAK